jgi:gamma-glutamyltranspeptidase/glutathione hydrolase
MRRKRPIWSLLILLCLLPFTAAGQPAILGERDIFAPVRAEHGMVVGEEALAVQAGLQVLQRGGNAVDAAVTVGFALAVTYPRAGNLGGGGFMLIYSARTGDVIAIDYRETAPGRAHRDMFLDSEGQVDPELSRFSHLAAGVPGTVAGLALALEKYGSLSLPQVLAPAIQLAESGFVVTPEFSEAIKEMAERLRHRPAARAVFFKADGSFYESGDLFVQKDLAGTLRAIARGGTAAFYRGPVADQILGEMERNGGVLSRADLAGYRPVVRRPVRGTYRGYGVYSMSPPSSGGVHIVQMLNILEGYDCRALGHNGAATVHRMAEAMKRAYADRSRYLGDPDFVSVPVHWLVSKGYAVALRQQIDPSKASPSRSIGPGVPPQEGYETTHFSIIDGDGNAVANTFTLNFSFGSGIVVRGAGFLLNNQMDDFSAKPGVPNAYGLVGGAANAIAPKKRMLSSMSPTIVLKEGKPFLITGSPGGPRIITTTLQIIMNVIDHGMNIQEAANAPRVHHQWLPDQLHVEEGLSPDTLRLLREMEHTVVAGETLGAASSILVDPETGLRTGAFDPRRGGMAVGY